MLVGSPGEKAEAPAASKGALAWLEKNQKMLGLAGAALTAVAGAAWTVFKYTHEKPNPNPAGGIYAPVTIGGSVAGPVSIVNVNGMISDAELKKKVEEILKEAGIDPHRAQPTLASRSSPELTKKIDGVLDAHRKASSTGQKLDQGTAFNLGLLAEYKGDFDGAVEYLHQAAGMDGALADDAAYHVSRLQQMRAAQNIQFGHLEDARREVADAEESLRDVDAVRPEIISQRGYNYKERANLADAEHDPATAEAYRKKAAKVFSDLQRLTPNDPSALNGLANSLMAAGQVDQAIAMYKRALHIFPGYAAAHHDLAMAYEDKMSGPQADQWCRKAAGEWREAQRLAPGDPVFTPAIMQDMGQRAKNLRSQCP
jgi:tetratricopeptide (TPR) repeat protein